MKRWLLALLLLGGAWIWPVDHPFMLGIPRAKLVHPEVQEVSGLVSSHSRPGLLWVHNDSGNKALIFGLDTLANVTQRVDLMGVEAMDWEDIVLVPGMHGAADTLWIADIGDNLAQRTEIGLYRIAEPVAQQQKVDPQNIAYFRLQYPQGPRDAETLLFDPIDQHFYIITKRQLRVEIYRFPIPQDTTQIYPLTKIGELPFTFLTGGSISRDGQEVLLKNLLYVYYWKREAQESLWELLQKSPVLLPYKPEAQGEAIDFSADGSGYYTLSERPLGLSSYLLFYPRTPAKKP